MEVILDEMTPKEFFTHGGVVKVAITNETIQKVVDRKKCTFFEYKDYVRFLNQVIMGVWNEYPDMDVKKRFLLILDGLDVDANIGSRKYILDPEYDGQVSLLQCIFYYYGERNFAPDLQSGRDPYGIKNVCFSLIDETDTRWLDFCKQREERGFDDSEIWSLDATIAKFISPRMEAFIKGVESIGCHPAHLKYEVWLEMLNKIGEAFRIAASDDDNTEEDDAKVKEGLQLFAEQFYSLWT